MTFPAMPGVPPVQQQGQQQGQPVVPPGGVFPTQQGTQPSMPQQPTQQPTQQFQHAPPAVPPGHYGTPQMQTDQSGFGQPAFGHNQPQATTPAGQNAQPLAGTFQAGPGIPAEWVGKTAQQVAQIYGNIKQELVRHIQQPQAQQPAQTQQPAQADAQKQANLQFWSDPVGTLNKLIQDQIQVASAPQVAIGIAQKLERTLPGFKELRPQIEAQMAVLPPQAQRDENAWVLAHKLAVADAVMSGQQLPSQQPQAPQVPTFTQPAPMSVPGPQHMQTNQPWQAAFTESPSNGFQTPSPIQLSQEELNVAERMGLTPEQWAAGRKITYGR